MNHIKIHFENCFGIKKFSKDLDFFSIGAS